MAPQENMESDKEKVSHVFKIPPVKKTSHRAHPYKLPIRCKRLPEITPTGVLDHGTWNPPSCNQKAALLDAMGMSELPQRDGVFHKPYMMLCNQSSNAGKNYVLKFYSISSRTFLREMEAVRGLQQHPYVFTSVSFRRVNNINIRVSSYLSNGSLASHIGDLDMVTVLKYFIKISSGVSFLHSRHVYLRNLRPEHILIDDDNNPQICDFSRACTPQSSKSLISQNYRKTGAVDPYLRLYADRLDGILMDSRSLGAVLYCMMFEVPYDGQHDIFRLTKDANNIFRLTKDARLPQGRPVFHLLHQIIMNLVTPETSARWNADRVLELFAQNQQLLLTFCGASTLEQIDPVFANSVRARDSRRADQAQS